MCHCIPHCTKSRSTRAHDFCEGLAHGVRGGVRASLWNYNHIVLRILYIMHAAAPKFLLAHKCGRIESAIVAAN